MSSALVDLLTSGAELSVDFLLSVPDSTDPATWQRASWSGCGAVPGLVTTRNVQLPGGLSFGIFAPVQPSAGSWQIAALGVTYHGQFVLIAPFDQPVFIDSSQVWPITVLGQVNPVQPP
jgi:hypothetical protein